MEFRKDIDGLRGIAVLSVILFHSGIGFASGGYIGVDVFFVISGFLITSSILSSIKNRKFSLLRFYERRVTRIFPATITVIIVTGLIGLNTLFPEELKELIESIYSFLKIQSNSWAAGSISYFGISTEFKPLIHLWSLSIELQFYIILPLILGPLLIQDKKNTALIVCGTLLLSSFIYASIQVIEHPDQAYFSSLMRAWQFLIGVLLSLTICRFDVSKIPLNTKNILVATGISMIFISVFIFDQRSNFPGINALLPCIGAVLILAFGDDRSFSGKCLSFIPLRFIGIISFSLYLVHQPIFAFYRILQGRELESIEPAALILISFILSVIIYFLIEQPFQSKNKLFKSWARSYVVILFILVLFSSYRGLNEDLSKFNITNEVYEFLKFRYDNNPRVEECRISNRVIVPSQACLYGDVKLPKVAVWGDSHADQLIEPLQKEFSKYGYSTLEFSVAGCPPIINSKSSSGLRLCSENSKSILEYLINNHEIKHVFLHAYWIGYIDNNLIQPNTITDSNANNSDILRLSFNFVINKLIESGKRVHLIYPVPKMKVNPPLYLAREKLINPSSSPSIVGLTQEEFENQSKKSFDFLNGSIEGLNVNQIFISDYLFDQKSLQYIAVDGDSVLYRDDNHLSVTGATSVAKTIASKAFGSL
ncbi:acyltransferase [Photobacterium galatheae]|uniref:acyltransferase family protein n=1 Tax=Photobacterium galatheae TaxID=1654360 RepID=UPI00202CC52A|nr:acyltransferase family protein [Photobacterium galatheae]MCM0151744.1 acyltransferase [Photobacterium galatheae]